MRPSPAHPVSRRRVLAGTAAAGALLVLPQACDALAAILPRAGQQGIEAAGPAENAARTATPELIAQLHRGRNEGAAERLTAVARTAFTGQFRGSPAVCLACTELPQTFPEHRARASFIQGGVTWINSSAAHIAAVVELACAEDDALGATLPSGTGVSRLAPGFRVCGTLRTVYNP
jgi:hypothetical protein